MRASPATVVYVGAAALGLALAYLVFVKAKAAAGAVVEDVTGAVTHTAEAVNPVNPDNVFARASNAVAQTISGDSSTTFGGFLFDLNPLNWGTNAKIAALSAPIVQPVSPPPAAPATPSNGSLVPGEPGAAALNASAPELSFSLGASP